MIDEQENNTFNTSASIDVNSLYTRKTPQDLSVVNYNGVLSGNLFVEALYSQRHFTFKGDGATSTDLIDGTLMIDNSQGYRFWSPTFCGVCDAKADNRRPVREGDLFPVHGGREARTT